MFTYKKIYIENWIQMIEEFKNVVDFPLYKEAFSYLPNIEIFSSCRTFNQWITSNNIQLLKAAVIVSDTSAGEYPPHVDSQINSLALNFPIENCLETETQFFKLTDDDQILELAKPNGTRYKKIIFSSTPKLVDSYVLDSPTILNTHIPHKLVNTSRSSRIALSFRFVNDPWHLVV